MLVGLVGAAVEFTWAVQEAVIIPYLLALGVPLRYSGSAYVVNPLMGVILQPYVGRLSDRLRKRKPFIAVLALGSGIGLSVLMVSYVLVYVYLDGSHAAVIGVALAAFTVSDICNDCLLVPARAMVLDQTRGDDAGRNRLNAQFSRYQVVGRLLALGVGSLPFGRWIMPSAVLDSLPQEDPGPVLHMMALTSAAVLVLAVTTTSVLVYDTDLQPGQRRLQQQGGPSYGTVSSAPPRTVEVSAAATAAKAARIASDKRRADFRFALVLFVQFYGWLTNMAQLFFWTAFLHGMQVEFAGVSLRVAYLGLAFFAMTSYVTSFFMQSLNKRFTPLVTYLAAEITLMLSMMALSLSRSPVWTVVIGGFSGLFYVFHLNNPFVILRATGQRKVEPTSLEGGAGAGDDDDEDDDSDDDGPQSEAATNAGLVGLVSATMPAAQIFVGVFAGPIITGWFHGNFAAFFSAVGLVGLVIDIVAAILLIPAFGLKSST